MKKCRNCGTNNSSSVYRCSICGSPTFERKTTGIILSIFAVYSLFNYFTLVLLPWKSQVEITDGDPSILVFAYLLQVFFVVISFFFSYRLWPSGYDWLKRLLGLEVSEDKSATFKTSEQERSEAPVPVRQNLQSTKQCSECKAMNPEIAKFCYSCSFAFTKVQTVKETIAPPSIEEQETDDSCPNCGVKRMTSEQKFCYNCGTEISEQNK